MQELLVRGCIKNGYEIVKELNRGVFAIAYEAKTLTGERVFFKQYQSPSPSVEWFSSFVKHQSEIKNSIENDSATQSGCYKIIEFFEDFLLYQVFEFIEEGKSLTYCINHYSDFSWETWLIFAKTIISSVNALHKQNIIHCDLKPDNIILIPDTDLEIGYKLKIIDFDWAFFSDKKAPWHGRHGYIGSPYYMSPEHIDGKTPSQSSDIFTCGIILGQLLGGQHPFHKNLDETYSHAAFKGYFSPIKINKPINDFVFLESILNACLNPDPTKRPTSQQIYMALST
jgi:serine/threonine protein kinase